MGAAILSREDFDFDRPIQRRGTDSVKHDGCKAYFGSDDLLPMWVADMDFAVPQSVSQALLERAAHPVFGYTLYPDSVYQALIDWMQLRHHWAVHRDWIIFTPGVVPALHAAVMAFTEPGDGVIVQTPVYFPFFTAVTLTGRRLLVNPLELDDGRYHMNLAHLERCATDGARLLLLCSPHNPVGRVWTSQELAELMEICRRFGITVISDEIHHDLIYPGYRHVPLARLVNDAADVVSAVAPSKTFNIPGLGLSALIVPDSRRRIELRKAMDSIHMTATNPFGIAAFAAAYAHGATWLDALLDYLDKSRQAAADFIDRQLPGIDLIQPEGTYLLWLDCRSLGLSNDELKRFFVRRARVGCNPGAVFGEAGSGFMRMNIGTTRANVLEALTRLAVSLNSR